MRLVYRHFPLMSIHDKAGLATQAAEAAGRQGKFWEMHDLLFAQRNDWVGLSPEDFSVWVTEQAATLGLKTEQFTTDMNSDAIQAIAEAGWVGGQEIGIPYTPFLIINGLSWPNNVPANYENLSAVVKLKLLEKRQFTYCPPMMINPARQYVATIKMDIGDIVIELFPDKAPLAVNNFVFLARQGWYDEVIFHRVIPGFVAQAGDPSGTGYGSPGYAFRTEVSDLKFDGEGWVAMANAGTDSNGSQFFITYSAQPSLDGGYTIFGKVIAGMDVVKLITARDPSQGGNLPEGTVIQTVIITEK